ncbi:hypothetical protein PROFUN_07669 [Planoprotostelium fungivorum]|uniref:Enolase-phosphatase E1 n=1 Tax=Planoprotostelium fungivorum TaxID=1890364 RepID=A0A2P6MM42_9EUKA|nr:hypothetical protein PROFUN_07669 [Planoprotostelium fungivorum]
MSTDIKLVLLDIEGTTTSISFVAEELFPYIRQHLRFYLESTWSTSQTQEDLAHLSGLSIEDDAKGDKGFPLFNFNKGDGLTQERLDDAVKNVLSQMDVDRKSTALKALQGHMWKDGYASGQIKAHIYEDVLPSFERWKSKAVPIYIYSSGSIGAQKLLFAHTLYGDLSPYLVGHYDTTSGLKTESQSYENILKDINEKGREIRAEEVLFVTDNILEAEAATKVGMRCVLSVRPGTKELPASHPFLAVSTFQSLPI